jgi:multiple sugar transport system permease protein
LWGYLFIGPFIIGFLAFTIVPMLASLYFSFTEYGLFDAPKWIGFENYIKMFTEDPRYINSLKVTIIYVFAGVPLRLAFALLVAMLLNVGSRAVGWYRTLYYLPSLIGGSVAVAIMWRNIFGDDGIVNIALKSMGIDSIRWFGEPTAAFHLAVWVIDADLPGWFEIHSGKLL